MGTERHVTSMEWRSKYKLREGKKEGQRVAGREKRRGRGGAGRAGRPSHHPADERLHHEGVLKVADGVAVLGPALVDSCRKQRNPSEDVPWSRTGWARKPPASEPEGTRVGAGGEGPGNQTQVEAVQ